VEDEGNFNIIQPGVLLHKDGKIQALARSRENYVMSSWSADGGNSWSIPEPSMLPNPNSGIDAVTLRDGLHMVVYNHSFKTEGKGGGPRTPLNVALSEDGINWETLIILEDEPGEFSYPAVIQGKDGTVHITYTWNRKKIRYIALNPKKIKSPKSGHQDAPH
jgi:alpha-L-rhamnosidase